MTKKQKSEVLELYNTCQEDDKSFEYSVHYIASVLDLDPDDVRDYIIETL